MKFKIIFIFVLGVILSTNLVSAGFEIPDYNPPFIEPVPEGILDKINQYMIDYSGISKDYFNEHYKVLNAFKTTYNCLRGGCKEPGLYPGMCFKEYVPQCNYTYAVHVLWKFKIDDYEAIVGDAGLQRYAFIIENNEIKKHFRYYYINQELQNLPLPKFREIENVIPKSQFDGIINSCVDEITDYPIKLAPKTHTDTSLHLFYTGLGKKDNKNIDVFIDLETGEYSCEEVWLLGEGEEKLGGVVADNSRLYFVIGIIVLVLIILVIVLSLKLRKK